MQISANKVVLIDYTLTNDAGEVIDTSEGREPLGYIQGMGNIIPGLENALENKTKGESLNVRIDPEEGYGPRNDNLIQTVNREMFEEGTELAVGMQFHASDGQNVHSVTITEIVGDDITIDANHPLAGVPLNFAVTIVDVREASEEELDHGHVHGEGGHHH